MAKQQSKPVRTCGGCRFFATENSGITTCHLYPPKAFDGRGEYGIAWMRPMVRDDAAACCLARPEERAGSGHGEARDA